MSDAMARRYGRHVKYPGPSPPSPPSDSAQANTTTDFEHSEQGPSANERVSELETSQ